MPVIPRGISRADVLEAIRDLDQGATHRFGPSRKFDLVFKGRRYPPKVVLGLAARRLAGRALVPEDFTGGSASQCHAVLEDLGFQIEEKVSDPGKLDRGSADAARAVMHSLLQAAPAAARREVLRFLAESVRDAAAADNARWAVKLEPDHVRFNVGQTESVVLRPDHLAVLVKDARRIDGTSVSGRSYPTAGGSRLLYVPYDIATGVLTKIGRAHLEAMSLARSRPCTRVIKDAHSPGVVEYLWQDLAMPGTPPVPEHSSEKRAPLTPRERAQALAADERLAANADLTQTEREVVIKQRLAQRLFRARLSAARRRCPVTGIDEPMHLRASHVKPWKDSNDRERQDPDNGLLLAPHVDHLFDRGLMSFEDDGRVLFARELSGEVLKAWGLERLKRVARFAAGQRVYLAYHRAKVFRGD